MGSISIKAVLNPRPIRSDGKHTILIRVTRNRVKAYITFPHRIKKENWSGTHITRNSDLNMRLVEFIAEIEQVSQQVEAVNRHCTPAEIKAAFENRSMSDFFAFTRQFAERYNTEETMHTFLKYGQLMDRIREYAGDKVTLSQVQYPFVSGFLSFLRTRKVKGDQTMKPGAISTYMNKLKAVMNEAMEHPTLYRPEWWPFKKIGLKTPPPTPKDPLTKEELQQLRDLKLPEGNIDHARNFFLLAVNLRGIRAGDLVTMKKESFKDGYLIYQMHKSKDPMSIKLTAEAEKIVKKYMGMPGEYLFPFFTMGNIFRPRHKRINSAVSLVNNNLTKIRKRMGLKKKLTTHVARYVWSNLALRIGAPVSKISASLGHSSEKITRIYLLGFSSKELDDLNEQVLG